MNEFFGWVSKRLAPKPNTDTLDHSAKGKVPKLPGLEERGAYLARKYLDPNAPVDGY